MRDNTVTSQRKIENLLRFVKFYGVRNPVTLGVIFNLWNDWEVMDKGVFTADLETVSGDPVLVIGSDCPESATWLRVNGTVYRDLQDILEQLYSLGRYNIYIDFTCSQIPRWHLDICEQRAGRHPEYPEPRPGPAHRPVLQEPFKSVYKEALMVLIDSALVHQDRDRFLILTEEWNQIA